MTMRNNKIHHNTNSIYEAFKEIKSLGVVIIIALCIRIFIFEPFYVPTGSMRKTIIEGDYVFSTKYSYGYSKHSFIMSTNLFSGRILDAQPKRGDVIIFRPPHMMQERYIKRLIGLPGEKIELKNGIVYINDMPINREYVRSYSERGRIFDEYNEIVESGTKYQTRYIKQFSSEVESSPELARANNIGPFFIPEDHYFFLGDNRDESGDSRFQLGFVPFENFIGKAQFIFFSFDQRLLLDNPLSFDQIIQVWRWITSFRSCRFFGFTFYK